MTEAEWIASADPAAILRHLQTWRAGETPPARQWYPPGERKLRLFACAVCRQVWDGVPCGRCRGRGEELLSYAKQLYGRCDACRGTGRVGGLTDPRSRRAVEVAERYADGLATEEERLKAERGMSSPELYPSVVNTAVWLAVREPLSVEDFSATIKADRVVPLAVQAALLRCVIGNPWRPVELPGPPCPDCAPGEPDENCDDCGGDGTLDGPCPWFTPAVLAVARAIYQERRPADLPILADALEEAGCDDAGLLAHLRQVDMVCPACRNVGEFGTCLACKNTGRVPTPHALPGCHVVSLILGKE